MDITHRKSLTHMQFYRGEFSGLVNNPVSSVPEIFRQPVPKLWSSHLKWSVTHPLTISHSSLEEVLGLKTLATWLVHMVLLLLWDPTNTSCQHLHQTPLYQMYHAWQLTRLQAIVPWQLSRLWCAVLSATEVVWAKITQTTTHYVWHPEQPRPLCNDIFAQ